MTCAKLQASDQEISVLSTATLANILVFADTLLLTDSVSIEALVTSIIPLLESLRLSQQRPQRFYAAAALANATAHPRLASLINQNGGLQIFRDVERQSLANLHILGSKLGDCAQTAIYRLTVNHEGTAAMGANKYRYLYYTTIIYNWLKSFNSFVPSVVSTFLVLNGGLLLRWNCL